MFKFSKCCISLKKEIKFGLRFASEKACSVNFRKIVGQQLQEFKLEGIYKDERVITSSQKTTITVNNLDKSILNFCANNYLGFSSNKDITEYTKEIIDKYGTGLSSVRFICGTQDIHKTLEKKIAKFHCRQDCILYPSCFDANAGLFESILTSNDVVFSDELNHASIIDGIRLCKAKKFRYKHRNMQDLEHLLETCEGRIKLIVTDGVFSMDGNIASLPEICQLAEKYDALVFLDECHATGFLGINGRGTEEHYGILGKVDIINSTLGKALGGASGGYTTGSNELIALLRQKSRPYLFSNSLPPPVVATGLKVMEILLASNKLVKQIQYNTQHFRTGMIKAGFEVAGENHPICPVMLEKGIYVIGFSYPVVPQGKARIRVQISAAHTQTEIDQCIEAFIEVGKELKVI